MASDVNIVFRGSAGSFNTASGQVRRDLASTEGAAKRTTHPLRGLALAAVGVAAAYLSIGQAKAAISTTLDLAKTTVALHRNLGLTNKVASEWAASAKARGVDTDALSTSFTNLSKNVNNALNGNKAAIATFQQLGITQRDLKATGGDFNAVLGLVADGLGNMEGGSRRAALAQRLLGRSSQTTLPIFTQGRKSMEENLKLADKYGVTLGGKPLQGLRDLQHAQKEMEFAQLGWQVTFATKIAPALTSMIQLVARASVFFREHATVAKIAAGVLMALVTAILAYRAAVAVATAFQEIFNVTLAANPIGAVIALIAALVVGLIYAYRHSETFRNIVNGAFHAVQAVVQAVVGFIVAHWRTMFPVLALVIEVIRRVIRNFDSIKGAASGVVNGIISAWNFLAGTTSRIWYGIVNTVIDAINAVGSAINAISPGNPVPHLGKKGGGGPPKYGQHLARGGPVFPGGIYRVGEQGEETLALGRGGYGWVFPRAMPRGGGGGGGISVAIINPTFLGADRWAADQLATTVQRALQKKLRANVSLGLTG